MSATFCTSWILTRSYTRTCSHREVGLTDPNECEAVTLSRLRLIRDRKSLAITLRQQAANCFGSESRRSEQRARRARSNSRLTQRAIARHKQLCAADQAAEERERESLRAQADQEARSSLSASVSYSTLASDGHISCFGGCQTQPGFATWAGFDNNKPLLGRYGSR